MLDPFALSFGGEVSQHCMFRILRAAYKLLEGGLSMLTYHDINRPQYCKLLLHSSSIRAAAHELQKLKQQLIKKLSIEFYILEYYLILPTG